MEAWASWASWASWPAVAAAALAVAAAAAALAGVLRTSSWLKAVRLARSLTGPPAVPLLGNVLTITNHEELMHLGNTAYELYGGVFRAWVTVFPMFVVLEPEAVQAILSSHKHTEKISLYRLLHNFLGQGLITSSGEEWRSHRRLIQPGFHVAVLEGFVATFHSCAQQLVQRLQPTGPAGMNITAHINNCVLNILNEAVLGIKASDSEAKAATETPFRKGKVVVPQRLVRPWLLLSWVYKLTEDARKEMQHKNEITDFARKALEQRRKIRKETKNSETGGRAYECLLDFLISISENNDEFTDEDIVNEVCTFMLAGQDSVGAALAFAVAMLAEHQDVQARVHAELDAVLGDADGADGADGTTPPPPPTRAQLAELRYLEQTLKETLRLFPSVPLVARRLGCDVQVGAHTLPRGAEVLISPFAVHRLAHVYERPDAFEPERFAASAPARPHPYAYIPFSAGPRNCIGYKFSMLEMKTVLATLLRKFRLEPVAGRPRMQLKYRLTLRSKGGVWVRLVPRDAH